MKFDYGTREDGAEANYSANIMARAEAMPRGEEEDEEVAAPRVNYRQLL